MFSAPSGLDVLDPSGFGQIEWRPVAPGYGPVAAL